MKTNLKKAILTTMVAISLTSCGGGGDTTIFATDIKLDKETAELVLDTEGKTTVTLNATVSPTNYNHGTLTWGGGKSYDNEIVSLTPSNDGKSCVLTAKKVGTAEVTVTIPGKDKELISRCNVTVKPKQVHVTSITAEKTEIKNFKETVTVGITINPTGYTDSIFTFVEPDNATRVCYAFWDSSSSSVRLEPNPNRTVDTSTVYVFASQKGDGSENPKSPDVVKAVITVKVGE